MALYNKSNKNILKESTSENNNNYTTASKFKPVLVKDLYRSFEQHSNKITTDSTQKIKAKPSKNAESYKKTCNYYKSTNSEGSSQKFSSQSSEVASNVKNGNQILTQKLQKIVSNKSSKGVLNLNNAVKSLSSEMQNPNINPGSCNYANITEFSNDSVLKEDSDLNLTNTIGNIQNVITQLKTVLEQSIKAHEDQVSKLKQILSTVNNISNAINSSVTNNDFSAYEREENIQKVVANKDSSEANLKSTTLNLSSPVQNKTLRTIVTESCEFLSRRRSLSTPSESDLNVTQGSFTMLEKQLNIVHKKLPAKSLIASPINAPPSTPTFAKQWDKKRKRPLKEYMALKTNSTFLVTPDVNWFQSRLDSTDSGDLYFES